MFLHRFFIVIPISISSATEQIYSEDESALLQLKFHFFYVIVCDERKIISNKHNAELQRTDPGTKVTGEFSVFKKYTKMIGHMPWLYQ